jgi:hypothetical protein
MTNTCSQKRVKQWAYAAYYYDHEDRDWNELESHAGTERRY